MSFLSILLVASAFYFAHARPDSQPWPGSHHPAQSNASYPEGQSAPAVSDESLNPADYQHHLYGLMQDLSKSVDQYVTPLMTKLEKPKQKELKSMCLNGFASYINYCLLLIQELHNVKDESIFGRFHSDSLPRDEMIVQFQSYHQMDPAVPYIVDTDHYDDEE